MTARFLRAVAFGSSAGALVLGWWLVVVVPDPLTRAWLTACLVLAAVALGYLAATFRELDRGWDEHIATVPGLVTAGPAPQPRTWLSAVEAAQRRRERWGRGPWAAS